MLLFTPAVLNLGAGIQCNWFVCVFGSGEVAYRAGLGCCCVAGHGTLEIYLFQSQGIKGAAL